MWWWLGNGIANSIDADEMSAEIETKQDSGVEKDKWMKRGAIIGAIWGFISSIFVIGDTLEPVGYTLFFAKASLIQWIIYFPGMCGAFLDYHSLLGFRIGIYFLIPAIFIGVTVGYALARILRVVFKK